MCQQHAVHTDTGARDGQRRVRMRRQWRCPESQRRAAGAVEPGGAEDWDGPEWQSADTQEDRAAEPACGRDGDGVIARVLRYSDVRPVRSLPQSRYGPHLSVESSPRSVGSE